LADDSQERDRAVVYSHPECGYCSLLIEDLNEKGVDYDEIDVSRDRSKWADVEKLTGGDRITPVTVYPDGRVEIGYNGIGCNFG